MDLTQLDVKAQTTTCVTVVNAISHRLWIQARLLSNV